MKKMLIGLLVCLVIVTGIVVATDEEDAPKSSYKSDYTPNKTTSHTCYVCGKSGNMKYGSHYYCATHWAMVKTVAEAD